MPLLMEVNRLVVASTTASSQVSEEWQPLGRGANELVEHEARRRPPRSHRRAGGR